MSIYTASKKFQGELLKDQNQLQLYFRKTAHGQGETTIAVPPQPVGILELEKK